MYTVHIVVGLCYISMALFCFYIDFNMESMCTEPFNNGRVVSCLSHL